MRKTLDEESRGKECEDDGGSGCRALEAGGRRHEPATTLRGGDSTRSAKLQRGRQGPVYIWARAQVLVHKRAHGCRGFPHRPPDAHDGVFGR